MRPWRTIEEDFDELAGELAAVRKRARELRGHPDVRAAAIGEDFTQVDDWLKDADDLLGWIRTAATDKRDGIS